MSFLDAKPSFAGANSSAPPPPPPAPPPPPNPASAPVQAAGREQSKAAQAAAAGGFAGTLLTGPQGAPAPSTAKQSLGAGK